MATSKPRITITLTEQQYEVLKDISDNSGQSMSAFVQELLGQAFPVMERMAETFRRLRAARDEQRQRIVDDLGQAQAAIEPLVGQAIGQMDMFFTKVERAAGVGLTPVTNRGVTPRGGKGRKPAPSKASRPIQGRKVSEKKRRR